MRSISANLNVMIKAAEKASKILIRDFGEIEKLQVSKIKTYSSVDCTHCRRHAKQSSTCKLFLALFT